MSKKPSDFTFDSFKFEEFETDESLQRTKEWLLKRNGCFTGSKIKELMGCGRSTAKQSWGSIEKLIDFSVTAEKYIYKVGKQRTTDTLEMEIRSRPTDHGKYFEPLLAEQITKDGLITDFEELGFEYFGDYKNGGASADGRATYNLETVGMELKCCVSWDGHFQRMYELVHDKHSDFWQHQSEMLAMGVDKLLYVVTEPMTVEKYETQIVLASEIHQKMILERCKIGDAAIDLWDKFGYKEALQIACANYAEENEIVT